MHGAPESIAYCRSPSPLGPMLVAGTVRGLCAVAFAASEPELLSGLQDRFPFHPLHSADLRTAAGAVLEVLEGRRAASELPTDGTGTAFQRRVWQELGRIPRGETRTYTQLAEALGVPRAVRAVAGACAANPLAVLVPCHRVVGKNGALTGYRWGMERKRALLALEARCL